MAQMSQVQELFHEAAQQVGLGGVGVCEKRSPGKMLNGSVRVHYFKSNDLRRLFWYSSLIAKMLQPTPSHLCAKNILWYLADSGSWTLFLLLLPCPTHGDFP